MRACLSPVLKAAEPEPEPSRLCSWRADRHLRTAAAAAAGEQSVRTAVVLATRAALEANSSSISTAGTTCRRTTASSRPRPMPFEVSRATTVKISDIVLESGSCFAARVCCYSVHNGDLSRTRLRNITSCLQRQDQFSSMPRPRPEILSSGCPREVDDSPRRPHRCWTRLVSRRSAD